MHKIFELKGMEIEQLQSLASAFFWVVQMNLWLALPNGFARIEGVPVGLMHP